MDIKISKLIEREDLNNCIKIESSQILYSGAKVIDFQTHWPNKKPFEHRDGNYYGIAFLNAFTNDGLEKIALAMNSYPDQSIKEINEIIEENRLKKYIHGNTQAFNNTFIGDFGSIFMEDVNNYKSVKFANSSAENRQKNGL